MIKEDYTMAIDVTSLMEAAIKSGALGQVSNMLGVDEKSAESAMEVVMPMLLKGMQGQAQNKETQYGFMQALLDHSKDDTDDLQKAVKNVDVADGAKIVNHLLRGAEQEEVAAKAKKKSGLDTKTILKLMAILAPILMSRMGKTAKAETSKASSSDMVKVVGGLLDGIDAKDVVNILGMFVK